MKIEKINELSIVNHAYVLPLRHIPTPPQSLYIMGKLPEKRLPTVAIIGSRKPSAYGSEVTHRLASELARSGVIIVSGLAYGIDAVAHKAALEVGGTTIAILANGLHKIYPVIHKGLAQEIVKGGGAIISEHPPGVEAMKHHFLARNRLVSGLADAIIVTEATERSGTFSTVAHALDQNKEVFAVPGPITSLLSAGPNRLLQQGAHVAINAQDILNIIAPSLTTRQTMLPLGASAYETRIIEALQKGIRDGAALQRATELPAQHFLQALTMLELNGVIHSLGGNQWALR
jgi:DNA processing protein